MKVTTDGCLLGAIAASEISSCSASKLLDIGTGTGLLSLMIAQQNAAVIIDAIEIDKMAAQQAKQNIAASPWANRIKIIKGDVQIYESALPYEIIISNPPFYENQLTSPKAEKLLAHHSSQLTLHQLFQQVKKLLSPAGKFFVMMPFYRTTELISIANEFNLHPEKQWIIKQTQKHDFFRSVFCFNIQNVTAYQPINICIEDQRNVYSKAFIELLMPYYLKL